MDWIRIRPSRLKNRVEVGLGVGDDSFPGLTTTHYQSTSLPPSFLDAIINKQKLYDIYAKETLAYLFFPDESLAIHDILNTFFGIEYNMYAVPF